MNQIGTIKGIRILYERARGSPSTLRRNLQAFNYSFFDPTAALRHRNTTLVTVDFRTPDDFEINDGQGVTYVSMVFSTVLGIELTPGESEILVGLLVSTSVR